MVHFFALLLLFPSILFANPRTLESEVRDYIIASLRTDAAIESFDRELDEAEKLQKPRLLFRSKTYREILALRHILEAKVEKITDLFLNLQSNQRGKGGAIAKQQLDSFFLKSIESSPAERIAYYELLEAMREELAHISFPQSEALPTLFATHKDLLAHENKYQKEITSLRRETLRKNVHGVEIQKMVQELQLEKLDDGASANRIVPSPGPEGNITGNFFPANTWALTYDDGPSAKNTLPILQLLQTHNKKATFFWLAENVTPNPEIVKQVLDAGMALNNHSYTHANLPKLKQDALDYEVVTSSEVEAKFFRETPRFFRCPYGAGVSIENIRKTIADQDMIHVFWNVDSLDWKDKKPSSILDRVKKAMGIEKKGVILFHDIHAQTVEASKLLLEYSASLDGKPNQFRWVTLPQIVDELNSRKAQSQKFDEAVKVQ